MMGPKRRQLYLCPAIATRRESSMVIIRFLYIYIYSTRIIHFFVPLFRRFFMRNCYIFMDFNCANESHPIRSKFKGSFLAGFSRKLDGAMYICYISRDKYCI